MNVIKQYDVFPSEGGWRYAGAMWAGGPIIDQSPWFATEKAARAASQKARGASQAAYLAKVQELGYESIAEFDADFAK